MPVCPRCGSAPPALRNVTRSLNCVAVFGVIGIAWHVLWIVAAGFLVAAFVDGSWNGNVWPQLYAAWEESSACDACAGTTGTGPPDASA
jgi:hypothetical protein